MTKPNVPYTAADQDQQQLTLDRDAGGVHGVGFGRRRVSIVLSAIAVALVVAHLAAGATNVGKSFLHLGREQTLPAVYSTVLLLLAAALLALIGQISRTSGRPYSLYWYGLALVFTFLAIDEAVEIHEQLIEPVRSAFDTSGLLYYAWVIPYVIGLLVLVVVYARFLLHLPRRTALGFVVAGTIFVLGAVVMESLTGLVAGPSNDERGIVFQALQATEEVLEIAGVIIFISVLLAYIETSLGGIEIHLARPTEVSSESVHSDQ
jgi:hypothetical protein